MTWMSCLIFSRRLITQAGFEKYYRTNFLQFATIFDYLAGKRISVYWESEPLVYGVGRSLPNWLGEVFEIFAKKWYDVIMSLPDNYGRASKLACIKAHGVKSELFSLKWLLGLRLFGYFNYRLYKGFRFYFPYVTDLTSGVVYLIAILPVPGFISSLLRENSELIKALVKRIR